MLLVLAITILSLASLAEARSTKLGVYLQFDSKPAQASVDAMRKEVDSLLQPAGYVVSWRWAAENQGREPFPDLVLVRFTGKCQIAPPGSDDDSGSLGEAVTLGSTRISGGHVLPFSEVKCDQVRKILPHAEEGDRRIALGRAMGRVVAHELYHFLANTTRHATRGLAKATQTWKELINGSSSFGQKDLEAIGRDGALGFRH